MISNTLFQARAVLVSGAHYSVTLDDLWNALECRIPRADLNAAFCELTEHCGSHCMLRDVDKHYHDAILGLIDAGLRSI